MKFHFTALLFIFVYSAVIAAKVDYYIGNDFATLIPEVADSLDGSGNFGDGFALILDRPTLIFDPSQNSFDQRLVLKYRMPDFHRELEQRLLHKATVKLVYAGTDEVAIPELAAYVVQGARPMIQASDYHAIEKICSVEADSAKVAKASVLDIDVTSAFKSASAGDLVTIVLKIVQSPRRVTLPFQENPEIEFTLAQQVHGMRNGAKARGRTVCAMSDAAMWGLELKGAPEGASAKMVSTTEFTFFGAPGLKVYCDKLNSDSQIILTAKQPIDLGSGFTMLEMWSWGWEFSYAIQRTASVTIMDDSGKEITRNLAMKLGCRGPMCHPCDFRDPFEKFDVTKNYRLKSIAIRNFAGTKEHDYFGLGPISVYPFEKSQMASDEFSVKIPAVSTGMIPPVPAESSKVSKDEDGTYIFNVKSSSGEVTYTYKPVNGTLDDITVVCGNETFKPMDGGGIQHHPNGTRPKRVSGTLLQETFDPATQTLALTWSDNYARESVSVWKFQLINRSLVIDITSTNPNGGGIALGALTGMTNPELLSVPYFCFAGLTNGRLGPGVVHSNGIFFYGGHDFYCSDAGDFYTDSRIENGKVLYNGGSTYMLMADLSRHQIKDRIFLTASPVLSEVFPIAPTPDLHDRDKAKNYFFFGVNNANNEQYQQIMDMGLNNLFYWLFWTQAPSDNAVDRLVRKKHGDEVPFSYQQAYDGRPAPELFRDINHKEFIAKVRKDGNLFGMYTYYTDADCNRFNYDPFSLARNVFYQPEMGCLGFCRLKPSCYSKYQKEISDSIKEHWGPLDGVYSDVITIRCFWGGTVDLEPGYPLSGKNHILACAQLAKQELECAAGLVYSEGCYQWLYAGLTSGSYGTIMTTAPKGPSSLPMLPEFNAYRIAPRSTLVGMSPGAHAFQNRGDNPMPHGTFHNEGLRQYYAALYGFGNAAMAIAWDISYMTMHGVAKLWYLFAPMHPFYLLEEIDAIEYFNGSEYQETSKAIASKSYLHGRIRKSYKNGTVIHVNYNKAEDWAISSPRGGSVILPPWGFYATSPDGKIVSCSVRAADGTIIDYCRTPEQLYLDAWQGSKSVEGLVINGAGAVRKLDEKTVVFYPLGSVPRGQTLPNEGVEEAVIDLEYWLNSTTSNVTVTGKLPDGSWHPFAASGDKGKLTIRPSGNYRQYKIELQAN